MDTTQVIGIIAGILTSSSLLPQLIKTIKDKKVEGVSILMFIVLTSGVILWIFYGIKRNDMPIIVTNGFSLLLNLIMIGLRIKYKK